MKILSDVREKLNKLPVLELVKEIVVENRAYLEDKNAEQLYAGEQPDGGRIEPEYSDLTVKIKKLKGQPFNRVTLKDEGDFHKSIKAEIASAAGFKMTSDDPKRKKLEKKYGQILGLSAKSKSEFSREILQPELVRKIKRIL